MFRNIKEGNLKGIEIFKKINFDNLSINNFLI